VVDVLTPEQRRLNMSRIRGKNTHAELLIRSGLHRRGFRFRLHRRNLPGTPDLVLPKYRTVIFVHGCFWHGHGCHLTKTPQTRTAFWLKKIRGNCTRDHMAQDALVDSGWRVIVVWECLMRGKKRLDHEVLLDKIIAVLLGKPGQLVDLGPSIRHRRALVQ